MDCEKGSKNSIASDLNDEEMGLRNMLQLPTFAENIFRHLPASDLSTCAKTCRSWNTVASIAKRKRKDIYVTSLDKNSPESSLQEKVLNLRSEPNLAIAIGVSDGSFSIAVALQQLLSYEQGTWNGEEEFSYWKNFYYRSIRKAKEVTKTLRKNLPRNCKFVNANLTAHEYFFNESDSPFLLLLPSIPEVEFQPFVIPLRRDIKIAKRRKLDPLIVSAGSNCLSKYVKCALVFAYPTDYDLKSKNIFARTSIADYVNEETIIIGARSLFCPVSAGIAISGENVRIDCVFIEDHQCYVRHCFLHLKDIGVFQSGIAFMLKKPTIEAIIMRSLWTECFPNIALIPIFFDYDSITSIMPSKVRSFRPCSGCGKQSNVSVPVERRIAIVFVCFDDYHCKLITV